jgi:hypothetical protein
MLLMSMLVSKLLQDHYPMPHWRRYLNTCSPVVSLVEWVLLVPCLLVLLVFSVALSCYVVAQWVVQSVVWPRVQLRRGKRRYF